MREARSTLASDGGASRFPFRQVLIAMIVFFLWIASALAGLTIGLALLRVMAILLASSVLALFSAALLRYFNFGLICSLLISIGSLTALQAFYLMGAAVRYLTRDTDERW